MSERIYASGTLVNAQTSVTANGTILMDMTDQGPYLAPSTSNAAVIQQWIQKTVNNWKTTFWSNLSFSSISTGYAALTNRFIGGVLLPDGRVVTIPLDNTTGTFLAVFNPATMTVTSYTTSYRNYAGGCLLPDGRALFAPYQSPPQAIGFFNPVTNTVTTGAATSIGCNGACVLPTGKVFLSPTNGTNFGIYDPVTNTFTSGAIGWNVIGSGSILIPDGRVIIPPLNATFVTVYNPATNTCTSYTGPPANQNHNGGVYCPGNNSVVFPGNSVGIFNVGTNTWSSVSVGASTAIIKATLLPDGRVIFAPSSGTYFGIFNPYTSAYSTVSASGSYQGIFTIPNGIVVMVGDNGTNFGIISGGPPVSGNFCLHPMFNKS